MTDTGLVAQMQATAATIEDLSTGGAPSGKRAWVVVVAAAAASLVDWHV